MNELHLTGKNWTANNILVKRCLCSSVFLIKQSRIDDFHPSLFYIIFIPKIFNIFNISSILQPTLYRGQDSIICWVSLHHRSYRLVIAVLKVQHASHHKDDIFSYSYFVHRSGRLNRQSWLVTTLISLEILYHHELFKHKKLRIHSIS